MISQKELKGINSPLRNFSLKLKIRSYKKQLEKLDINYENKVILDAGCGRGFSTKILCEKFQPKEIYAFDYLEEQIQLAKQLELKAIFWVGDITSIHIPDENFDIVFAFNVLHHVPHWKQGILEISRVIKNQGYAIFEEPTGSYTTFTDKFVRNKHPDEAKFSKKEFEADLLKNNFIILKDSSTFFGKYIALITQKKNPVSSY